MGVLRNVRVADFTWAGAGPYTTRILALHGATVIKVESRTRPDSLRAAPPFAGGVEGTNRSGYFAERNCNKLSLGLNMSKPEAREIALQLISKCEIVANNFSAGTMEKWGLGYEAARTVRPDVIYLSMPMQGSTGPHRSYIGYGATVSALIGLFDRGGLPGREPLGTGTNYPDHVANPAHAAVAVLAALIHRRRTGQGQYIELSQAESSTAMVVRELLSASANGVQPGRPGNSDGWGAPRGVYRCAGQDSWCAIDVRTESQWRQLTHAMGRDDLTDDARFSCRAARLAHAAELDAIVSEWSGSFDPFELAALLQRSGVPAGPAETSADMVERDAQLTHRGHWAYLDHPEMGTSIYSTLPYRLSATPSTIVAPAPTLGQHTDDVARSIIGLSDDRIQALRSAGVLE